MSFKDMVMLTIRGWFPQEPKKPKNLITKAKPQSSLSLKLFKRERFILTIGVSITILIIILIFITPPTSGSGHSGFLDLTSGDIGKLHLRANQGSKIKLEVSIQGVDKGIYFYMTDWEGKIVFNAGKIYDQQQIEWSASSEGNWFIFDNEASLSGIKNIFYSISIRAGWQFNFSAAGICMSILLGLLLIYRKKDTILSWGIEEQESLDYLREPFDLAFDKSQEY